MKIKDKIDGVINDLSQLRFSPYQITYGNSLNAFRGYRQNMVVSQAVWEASAVFEVILRNRIVESWNSWYRVNGFLSSKGAWPMGIKSLHNQLPIKFPHTPLNSNSLNSLEQQEFTAFKRARKEIRSRTVINGDVIARLTFGFWHECFSRHFRFINASQVKDILPYYPYQHSNIEDDLADIAKDLQAIKDFRNRLAHHEKLDMNRVKQKYAQICEYISYINPNALKLVSIDGFDHVVNFQVNKVVRNFPYL